MATIRLITKQKKGNQPVSLYLRFKEGRTIDLITVIPLKVYPEYWNNNKGEFRKGIVKDEVFTDKYKCELESKLSKLKTFILENYNELATSNGANPTIEWLKTIIDKHFNKVNSKKLDLNLYIEQFIKEIESGERLYDHNGITKRYEKGSVKNFKGFQVQFKAYQKDKRKQLNFNDITLDFYDEYVMYFTNKDYSINTIGRHVKNLKTIMRCAKDEGLHKNEEIERKKFKVLRTQVENIYLTQNEIDTIYNLDLSNRPLLDLARDIFLIGCYTAQRFSDYSKIRPENIKIIEDGQRVIDLIQQKTSERVIIPIKPQLDAILAKYNYQVPKAFEQKINERIKEVGQMAGITETVIIEENKGGFKIKKDVPKNELIKTHTARRTGCTLMYLAGIPTIDIMKISGHKSEREFLNYIKVGKEETAQSLSKHPYFMGTSLRIAK